MNSTLCFAAAQLVCFAIAGSGQDAYIPEIWATEALDRLEETMVMANLVHRDFENDVKSFGDVVNTRRPGDFELNRKTDSDTLTVQTPNSSSVQVPLDQWFTTAFVIKDGERSLAFQDLIAKYIAPAATTMARGVDRALLGRIHAYLVNKVGRLGKITSANAGDFLLDARNKMSRNLAPVDGRNMVLSPEAETAFLKNELFIAADQRGDGGNALTNALLGRIYGHATYMGQNVNGIRTGADTVSGTVTNAAAAGASGAQTVSISAYEVKDGEYAVVDGDDQPNVVDSASGTTNTTSVTLVDANVNATLAGASITVYKACTVDGAYSAGHSKRILVDGFTANKGPQVGQLLAFGLTGSRKVYTVIESRAITSTSYSILLDRPLESAVADNAEAYPGPVGSMNWVFHRNAIALVSRPLVVVQDGVRSGVSSNNGLSMRVSMQYDINQTGTIVHFDMLAGVAVLDTNLACVLLG